MPTKKAEPGTETIDILRLERERVVFYVVGTTPLILNRMSQKVRKELLLPEGRKSAVTRQSRLKHEPLQEFAASPYRLHDDAAPTLLAIMGSAVKGAMMTAALEMPGAKKAQIGRLVRVEGEYLPVYGEPQLSMMVTRNSDINHTPDIRSRAILPHWACRVAISFLTPTLRVGPVSNLLAAAGEVSGLGDYRIEKGKGDYGMFRLAGSDDPEWLDLSENWGRAAQSAAMVRPAFYDAETEELYQWFEGEAGRRGFTLQAVS